MPLAYPLHRGAQRREYRAGEQRREHAHPGCAQAVVERGRCADVPQGDEQRGPAAAAHRGPQGGHARPCSASPSRWVASRASVVSSRTHSARLRRGGLVILAIAASMAALSVSAIRTLSNSRNSPFCCPSRRIGSSSLTLACAVASTPKRGVPSSSRAFKQISY